MTVLNTCCISLLLTWCAYACDIKEFTLSPSSATATVTEVTVKCEADNSNCRGKISISGQYASSNVFDEWSSQKTFTPGSAGDYTYECDFTHGGVIYTRTAKLSVAEKPCKISSFSFSAEDSGSYQLQCEADCEGTMRLRQEGISSNIKKVTSTAAIDTTIHLTSYGTFGYVCLLTANNKAYTKTVTIQYAAPCGIGSFTTTNTSLVLNSTTNYLTCQTQGCSGEVTITPPSGLSALGPIQTASGGTKVNYNVKGEANYSGDYTCSFKGTNNGITETFTKTLTLLTDCPDPIMSTFPDTVYRNTNLTLTCDSRDTCDGTTHLVRDGIAVESTSESLISYTTQLTITENIAWECSVKEGGRIHATTQTLLVQDCEGGAEYTLTGTRCGKLDCDSGVNAITSCANDITQTTPACRCPDSAQYWENNLCVTACSSGNVSAVLAFLGLSWWVYLILILLILIILILLCCCVMYCCYRKKCEIPTKELWKEDFFSFAMNTLKTAVRGPRPVSISKDDVDIKGIIPMYDKDDVDIWGYEEPEYAYDVEFSDDEVYDDYLVPEDTIERLKSGQPPLAPALPSAPIPTLERDDECYNDPSSMQLKGDTLTSEEGLVYENATPDYPPREPHTPDIPKQDYKNLQDVPAKPQRRRRSSSSSSSIIPIIEKPAQPDYVRPDTSYSSNSNSKIQVKGKISEAQPDYDNLKHPSTSSSSSSSSSSKSSSKIEVKGKISRMESDYDNLQQPEQTYQNNKR